MGDRRCGALKRNRCSLPELLCKHRGRRNRGDLPRLSIKKIVTWADAQFQRTGKWPNVKSGPVPEAPGEQWHGIDTALRRGLRGLPGRSSLALLLARKRGLRHRLSLPPLTDEQILQWAEQHFQRTGKWPSAKTGPITDAPGETWGGVDRALCYGRRSLPGGSSLSKLLPAKKK
jgi:hypothetical protein